MIWITLNRKSILHFISYVIIVFISACAQIVTPTGGKVDVIPPKPLAIEPINNSTNFISNKIIINFDEYFLVREAPKQVLISPPLKNFPEFKTNGKKLLIEIKDTLSTNTTYTVNFGNAIADNNEGNVLKNFKYVFSTGTFIDSLQLNGTILNSVNLQPELDFLVCLYNENLASTDSFPQQKLPNYYSKTDKDGNFVIENIKFGNYKIVAFSDINGNFLYDAEDEKIAFDEQLILIDKKNTLVNLVSFKAEPHKQFVKKTFDNEISLQVILNKMAKQNILIQPLQKLPKDWAIIEKNKTSDTLKVWYSKSTKMLDSLSLLVYEGDKILDTIHVNIKKARKAINNDGRIVKQELKLTIESNELPVNKNIKLNFSMPISKFDAKKILLIHGKDTLSNTVTFLDSLQKSIGVNANFKQDSAYKLVLRQFAFTAINELESDTMKYFIKIHNNKNLGTLKLKVNAPNTVKSYIFQLISEKGQLIDETKITASQTLSFSQLLPGKYSAKLIADNDENGMWSTGNFNQKHQPEKVYLYSGNLVVRPNWDLEETWNIVDSLGLAESR